MKATIKNGEEAIEVGLDEIQLPEHYRIVSQAELNSIAKQEKEQARRAKETELKAHYESDEYINEALKAKGFQFGEDGLPVPIDGSVAKDALAKQRQRIEREKAQEFKPLQDENSKLKEKITRYRESLLEKQILEAAHKANVTDAHLTAIGSGKPPIYYQLKDNLSWFEDDDVEGWFVRDGDTYRVGADGKPVDVYGFFSELQSKEETQGLFKDVRRQSSGLQKPVNTAAVGGDFLSFEEWMAKKDKMTPEQNMAHANYHLRGKR